MSFVPLETALRRRLDVVGDHGLRATDPKAHLEALKAAHRELEIQIARLPVDTPPQLFHFLQQQSYEKAHKFLKDLTFREPGGLSE
ncbi:MAG: hypothetical protein IAE94_13590 [Chthoniobacterales bacterium]|nr:hypothetical protein [Chthoniobacterales bacterium]